MVNENKNKVFAAVAGAVVGAGAVLAGAIAMSDKANQRKVKNVLSKAKGILKGYGEEAIKSAELTTSKAKKGVKSL